MVKLQLVVAQAHAAPRLCILAGPTFRNLVTALQALPHRTYVASNYWIVDTPGLARLQAAGLEVETGMLEPTLRELAHRATCGLICDPLPVWQRSPGDWP
jgi:hypothetical protein